jgi:hypothetical protein
MNEEMVQIIADKEIEGDDSFFWEELLADDEKDWSEEYLGV